MARMKNPRGYDRTRDAGPFVAMPWVVLDSDAYKTLSHPAKSLLMEIARQYVRDNNGRLLASRAYLAKRGWKSADTISRAIKELTAARLIHQTVQGHRPNKASWFAVTWRTLDRMPGYDAGAVEQFERGSYSRPALKNSALRPPCGLEAVRIAPLDGPDKASPSPSGSPIKALSGRLSSPADGHHLDKPSDVFNQVRGQ